MTGARTPATAALRAMPLWLRVFLLLNVVQDFAIGASGMASPAHITIPLEDVSPLNARFIAALYIGGGIAILALFPDIVTFLPRLMGPQ
jgi:hypothetical protein